MGSRKRHNWTRHGLFMLMISCFFIVQGEVAAALDAPPAWSPGQWWVVESQTYNTGKIRHGDTPGWEPKVGWRFQVKGIEDLGGEPHYVVAVTPLEGNKCAYTFRYWFRVSDRTVGRREVRHPARNPEVQKDIGPPVVARSFNNKPNLLSNFEFPALPVTIPVFSSRAHASSAGTPRTLSQRTQAATKISTEEMKDKADPAFMAKVGARVTPDSSLVKISQGAAVIENQYWNAGLPWCVYGEQSNETFTSRRYWLVDMGSN
jgi:hypothetical protein